MSNKTSSKGSLFAVTGRAGCGKDGVLDESVDAFEKKGHLSQKFPGSGPFRAGALLIAELGYGYQNQLPEDLLSHWKLVVGQAEDIYFKDGERELCYLPNLWESAFAGQLAHGFAQNSPDVYGKFMANQIKEAIIFNSEREINTFLGARRAHIIADELEEVQSLKIYLTATEEVRRSRLKERYEGQGLRGSQVEAKINADFERDERDEANGILTRDPLRSGSRYVDINDASVLSSMSRADFAFEQGAVYRLDSSELDKPQTVSRLELVATAFMDYTNKD